MTSPAEAELATAAAKLREAMSSSSIDAVTRETLADVLTIIKRLQRQGKGL